MRCGQVCTAGGSALLGPSLRAAAPASLAAPSSSSGCETAVERAKGRPKPLAARNGEVALGLVYLVDPHRAKANGGVHFMPGDAGLGVALVRVDEYAWG